jgi:hypothetical protein
VLIPLTVVLLIVGGLCLGHLDRPLARVWICGFVAPVALVAVLGLSTRVMWPKTIAYTAWAPMLALAAIVEVAARRWRPLGLVAAGVVALVVLPSTAHAIDHPQVVPPSWGPQVAALKRVVRPGDAVAGQSWLVQPVEWYFGQPADLESPTSRLPMFPYSFVPRPGPPTGRVWAVDTSQLFPALGFLPCGPPRRLADGSELRCFQRG